MFISADTMALLLDLGVTGEKLVALVRSLEADARSAAPVRDEQAERRRAADRERRRLERQAHREEVCGQSADMSADTPPPRPLSPQTPLTPTPPPGDISTRARKGGPTKVEIARGFAAFWAAYPKRVGKDAAAKSFAKALARIDDADPLAVILAGIERALPGWDDPQFIPHPATWLNQGRWADEEPAKPTPQRSPHVHRPDRHTAQLDHLAAISRAMGDVDHGGPGDRDCGPPADHGGGMRRLDTAA